LNHSRKEVVAVSSVIVARGQAALLESFNQNRMGKDRCGPYVSVEPLHLFRYLDEQSFRFNYRTSMSDLGRFETAMKNISGNRLIYSELTGAGSTRSHWETARGW
jgi:hypothetical protein